MSWGLGRIGKLVSSVSCLSILCFLLESTHSHMDTRAHTDTRQEVCSCQGDNMGTTASSWEPGPGAHALAAPAPAVREEEGWSQKPASPQP